MNDNIDTYLQMLTRFGSGEIDIYELERQYLPLFKQEERLLSQYELLNDIFTSLDMHVGDQLPLGEGELNTEMATKNVHDNYLQLCQHL